MNVWASASRLASSSQCLRGPGYSIAESSAKAFVQVRCESSTTNPSQHNPQKLGIPSHSRRRQRKKVLSSNSLPSTSRSLPTAVNYNSSSFHASKTLAKIMVAAPPLQNGKHNLLSRYLSLSIVKAKVRKRKSKRRSSSVSTAGDFIHFATQTAACANSGFFSQIYPLNLLRQQ